MYVAAWLSYDACFLKVAIAVPELQCSGISLAVVRVI